MPIEALTSSQYHTTIQRLEMEEERIWKAYQDALRQEAESGESRKREKRTYRNSPRREKTKQSTKILVGHKKHVEYTLKIHERWMRQEVEKV